MRVTTDSEFTCQSRRVARTLARTPGAPIYRYIFAQGQEGDPALSAGGIAHTIEHSFLFPGQYRPTPIEAKVQHEMIGYWTRMAKTGNPNRDSDKPWPATTVDEDHYLEIGANTAPKKGPAEAKCDFWDTVPFLWPHL